MTRALLDHPWALEEVMNARSPAYSVLLDFERLVRRYGLAVVPFVVQEARTMALQRLRGRTTAAANARRFFEHCVRLTDEGPLATPLTETELGLSTTWRQALRAELRDPDDWRIPQIIVPRTRSDAWPNGHEVQVRCEDSPDAKLRPKVLARLDHYDEHPFAESDLDPWACLEKIYRPEPGTRIHHPCVLPKPPILREIPARPLTEALTHARALGWTQNGRYYYIPPPDHDINAVTKEQWRKGRAFPWEDRPGLTGPRLLDTNGIIWVWDRGERHWDVQLPDYISVSHDGRKLP
jgi:hypothetical protein